MTSAMSVVLQTEKQPAGSIRSVASNSSITSGVNPSPRPRIRTRAKTLTTEAFDARARADAFAIVGDRLFLGTLLVDEPTVDGAAHRGDNALSVDSSAGIHTVPLPQRPPRSPQRPEVARIDPVSADGKMDEQPSVLSFSPVAQQNPQHEYDNIISRYDRAGDSSATPSTDNHDSFRVSARPFANVRGSIATHKSISSSSLYPPSTSTTSGTDSASPHSMLDLPEHDDAAVIGPEIDEAPEFDGDDVSFRLRLLMKNSYFLPPAHSKPSLSDLAQAGANGVKKSTRQTTPTFLDLFRMGRSKPRPQPLSSPPDVGGPILRTTCDQNSLSGAQTRLSPTTPLSPSRQIPVSPNRVGRVVVVREKMNDLAGAAKQAEQEMKARSTRREQGSQRGHAGAATGVIDPTDAVDLPPPVAGYPFPVQASAFHGLGVEDSVGAAVLAEHLPPPNSPGMSMLSPEEYAWRKALLCAAVGHSLQNSPAVSTTSPSPVVTTSMDSSRLTDSGTPPRTVNVKRALGQQIIAQPLIEESPTPAPRARTTKGRRERGLASPDPREAGRTQSYLPRRAETPSVAPFPLAPPPRRQIFNPLYSLSQTDLTRTFDSRTSTSSYDALRRAVSSPRLSDAYESDVRGLIMTPPPASHSNIHGSVHSHFDSSFEVNRALASQATTTDSHYSEDHAEPRNSASLSIPTTDRPCFSDYSQPSPTASAFQDALDYPYHPSPSNSQTTTTQNNQPVTPRVSNVNPTNRYTSTSPPPRVSSSLANVVLSPPPRSTSLSQNRLVTRLSTSTGRSPSSDLGHLPVQPAIARDLTSPLSTTGYHGQNIPLSLHIPSSNIPPAVRSAPPASPIAFFDDIQAQPNAMDDLDSSSDEDDNGGRRTPVFLPDMRTRSTSNLSSLSSKPLAMKMGNHSSPHVSRSYERRPLLPIGPSSPTGTSISKLPIGNLASPMPFFKNSKSDLGHGPLSTALDPHRFAQQSANASETRPSRLSMSSTQGVPIARAWQTDQKSRRDSVQKLDGMLIRHMETERDTIKRIASSARQSKV